MLTFQEIKNNHTINTYISKADETMRAIGFTEHSFAHVTKTASTCKYILETLGYSAEECELAQIASYLHDIGNLFNRAEHAQSGAAMAFQILSGLNASPEEIATITTAIANHDENTAVAVNAVTAALIISDKSDVRRSRVRNTDITNFDIHDRVNYSVENSKVIVDKDKHTITLNLTIITEHSSIMDYFEIFLTRMILCRKAAEMLNCGFHLVINGQQML